MRKMLMWRPMGSRVWIADRRDDRPVFAALGEKWPTGLHSFTPVPLVAKLNDYVTAVYEAGPEAVVELLSTVSKEPSGTHVRAEGMEWDWHRFKYRWEVRAGDCPTVLTDEPVVSYSTKTGQADGIQVPVRVDGYELRIVKLEKRHLRRVVDGVELSGSSWVEAGHGEWLPLSSSAWSLELTRTAIPIADGGYTDELAEQLAPYMEHADASV